MSKVSYTLIILFYTQFLLCISFGPSNICMSRSRNMWFGCGTWGRNLIPFDHPGNIRYAYLLLSHARRWGLDRDSHMEVESYLIMNNNKVATLIYIWVDWLRHLGNPVLPVLGNPGVPVWFFLWFATQAQRDHKIIHARNFRVQPQAIMGSGIVE